jgi:hypothetical protein
VALRCPARDVDPLGKDIAMRVRTSWTISSSAGVLTLLLAAMMCGCASFRQSEIRETEDLLAAAGFTMKRADSAEKTTEAGNLPPHKFVVIHRNGAPYYIYADPEVCQCIWVGDQQQYSRFQQLSLQKQIADEQLMTAQALRDAAFRWELWDPWPWF